MVAVQAARKLVTGTIAMATVDAVGPGVGAGARAAAGVGAGARVGAVVGPGLGMEATVDGVVALGAGVVGPHPPARIATSSPAAMARRSTAAGSPA